MPSEMESKQNTKKKRRAKGGKKAKGFGKGTGKNAGLPGSAKTFDTTMVIRSLNIFPMRTKRTLQYYMTTTVITGTSSNNAVVYRANSMYDPEFAIGGGQPMGFDQMMNFYDFFHVIRSRIRVIVANTSVSLTPSVAVNLNSSSTVTSSIEQLIENGNIAIVQLMPANTPGSMATLTKSCDIRAVTGVDDILDDPDLRGSAGADPAIVHYFHVNTWNPYTATQVTSNLQVLLEYEAVFHSPKKGALS